MKNRVLSMIIFILFLTGCTESNKANILPTIPYSPTQATNIPTHTMVLPTKTPIATLVPTQLPAYTITPTQTAIRYTQQAEHCIDISTISAQPTIMAGGTLIYSLSSEKDQVLAYNPQKGRFVLASGNFAADVSPYTGTIIVEGENYLWVRYADGKEKKIPFVFNNAAFGFQWLAGDQFIEHLNRVWDWSAHPAIDEIELYDIATEKVQNEKLEMNGYFARGLYLPGPWISTPIFDSNMTRAVYAWENPDNQDQQGLLLWDLQEKKTIWKLGDWFSPIEYSIPNWQLDGSQLVFSAYLEKNSVQLWTVSRNGEFEQMTHFQPVKGRYAILEPTWSPDGRFIAMIKNADILQPLKSRLLQVYDIKSDLLTNYCISPVSQVTWSPDSTQLAFIWNYEKLILLDLPSGKGQLIANANHLWGWTR